MKIQYSKKKFDSFLSWVDSNEPTQLETIAMIEFLVQGYNRLFKEGGKIHSPFYGQSVRIITKEEREVADFYSIMKQGGLIQ